VLPSQHAHPGPANHTAQSAESALDARERWTAELGALGASQGPGCCKHQSSGHPTGGRAAGIGHNQPHTVGLMPARQRKRVSTCASRRTCSSPESRSRDASPALEHEHKSAAGQRRDCCAPARAGAGTCLR
jgi:hypothetical protein